MSNDKLVTLSKLDKVRSADGTVGEKGPELELVLIKEFVDKATLVYPLNQQLKHPCN